MTSTLALMLLMQFVVSTKAGLVNYVQGDVNVKVAQNIEPGLPIKTGPGGFAEILLNPGSYLRLNENSEAMLDGVELTDIAVRIVSGTAIIEAIGFDKDTSLKVTSGNLTAEIIKDGIFMFSRDKVTILEGKLQTADSKIVFTKGWQLSKDESYRAIKAPKGVSTVLETWSRNRSELISMANMNIANSLRRMPAFTSSWIDCWLWVPSFGAYTFMPGYRFRSPYGYRYVTFGDIYYRERGGNGNVSSASGGGVGNSNNSNGGGGFGGGGGGGTVTPMESRPIGPHINTNSDVPVRPGRPGGGQ